jgi:hypothetical protein
MPSSVDSKKAYIGDELTLFSHVTNWKSYWSAALRPLIKGPVLEVGAGIGSNLSLLRTSPIDWTALEPDSSQCDEIQKQIKDHNVKVVSGYLDHPEVLSDYQTILYIDVLEHIEQDCTEIALAFSKLAVDGRLIILAPAHQSLFSQFDKAVGHFRRYNKTMLKALTPPEAKIEKLFYLDSVGLLASLANSWLLKSSMPTTGQIWLWDKLMIPVSRILDRLVARKLGKTIVIVCSKP